MSRRWVLLIISVVFLIKWPLWVYVARYVKTNAFNFFLDSVDCIGIHKCVGLFSHAYKRQINAFNSE